MCSECWPDVAGDIRAAGGDRVAVTQLRHGGVGTGARPAGGAAGAVGQHQAAQRHR